MKTQLYQRYLQEYVQEAIRNSDGTTRGIYEHLAAQHVGGGFLVKNKEEKRRALEDARIAFDEHRHWPVEIVLSHLGVETDKKT